jgi:hypothetical protein
MTTISEYVFTGYMPSGNPFLWFYDENKRTSFATSFDTWTDKLKRGDRVKMERDSNNHTSKVWANGVLIYEKNDKDIADSNARAEQIYDNLKREKGLI